MLQEFCYGLFSRKPLHDPVQRLFPFWTVVFGAFGHDLEFGAGQFDLGLDLGLFPLSFISSVRFGIYRKDRQEIAPL
jgi:hypothetical protein